MKGKVVFILIGVVSLHLVLLGGICLTGGCKSSGEKAPESTALPPPAPVPGKPVGTEFPPFAPSANTQSAKTSLSDKGGLPPFSMDIGKSSSAGISGNSSKYTVKNGDSLWKIAKSHGVSIASIASANNIPADKGLKVGQVLTLPAGAKAAAEEKQPAKTTAAPSKKAAVVTKSAPAESTAKSTKKSVAPSTDSSESGTYIVKSGDTLAKIASKNHIKLETLAKANNIDTKKQLRVGQKIVLPKSGTSVAASANEVKKPATAEKTEKTDSAKKSNKKDSAKKGSASTDKTEKTADSAAAAPTAKTTSKVDENAKKAIESLNNTTTETSTDLLEDDLNKDTKPVKADSVTEPKAKTDAKPETKTDSKSASKPASKLATDTVEINEETTIQAIATTYGVKVDDLKKVNQDIPSNGKLLPGMTIILP